MKLLLRRDIAKVGLAGDVIEVSEGYARNYLIPHHLAVEPTKANMKAIEEDKRLAEEERRLRRAALEEMAGRMRNVEVTIAAACNEEGHLYGSVGPREIAAALRDEGHDVETPSRFSFASRFASSTRSSCRCFCRRHQGRGEGLGRPRDRQRRGGGASRNAAGRERPGREARPYDHGTGVDALDIDL